MRWGGYDGICRLRLRAGRLRGRDRSGKDQSAANGPDIHVRLQPATLGYKTRDGFPARTSGILCSKRGRKSADRPLVRTCRPGRSGAGDQHEARAEELAGLCQFSCDTPGVQNGGVLIGALASSPVRTKAGFVDDVKEVAHADGLGRCVTGFQ